MKRKLKLCGQCARMFGKFVAKDGKEYCSCGCEAFTDAQNKSIRYCPSYCSDAWETIDLPAGCLLYAEYFVTECNDDGETEERH